MPADQTMPTGPDRDDALGPADDDDLGRARHRARTATWMVGLALLLVVTVPAAIGLGPVPLSPDTVTAIIAHHLFAPDTPPSWSPVDDAIVWLVRLPRVLLGAAVGGGLALSGAALQAMVRNVLADPYILGVTSGASTGAALTILFGVGAGVGASSLTASAFLGAMLATGALFVLARVAGQITSVRLLLAGVTIGYILSAATSFLIFASDKPDGARDVLFWLLGSLSYARWSSVGLALGIVTLALVVLVLWGRKFDALAIGDDTARALGTDPARHRVQALIVVSLCVGAVVAVAGGIGFVGLVVPHLARRCVGGTHRRLYPVAALIGASFLVWADVCARVMFPGRELPLGIVTAVAGAPLLVVLVRRLDTPTR